MRERAKQQMPMVLLTLLSIIQALALELLWAHIRAEPMLLSFTGESLLAWLQIIVTLMGIILIWLLYSSVTMRFTWTPTPGDSVIPFGIGLLEFTLIASLGLDYLPVWFVLLAMLFAVMPATLQSILRRARLEQENSSYFAAIPPATLRDFFPAMLIVLLLAALGLILQLSGDQYLFALISLLIAAAAHAYQMYLSSVRWKKAMLLQ
ncbi:MAG: hypothetical protein Q7W55_16265 [Pseudohongiella sp.]|nr:hypothetical protein [Pseudohongiella sp.]MDO9520282.1 hypothetical protein [Pseudohongiella sp.]MDP2127091.1 hypothetical protein [Pseudohongiella sp.]